MTIVQAITAVFDAISTWLVGAVGDIGAIFYVAETGLTFLGTLATIGLAIGIVFLLVGLVQNFLRMRS